MNIAYISCGDCNGISPEIIFKHLENPENGVKYITGIPLSVASKFEYFSENINSFALFGNESELRDFDFSSLPQFTFVDMGEFESKVGYPTVESGRIAYKSLICGIELIKSKLVHSIVTAPLSKEALDLAGVKVAGHTEILTKSDGKSLSAMYFVVDSIRFTPYTIHIPIKDVPSNVVSEKLSDFFALNLEILRSDFGIISPSVAVLGLNPHAGENGIIGKEETEIINSIKKYSNNFYGPFPADGFFARENYKNFDLVIGMYHDQVLIPFKMLDKGRGVNFTAGLSFVRTSPDHGTAFDIAGKGIANSGSFNEAIKLAIEITNKRGDNVKS
ncbi:MAG: 4-hydroxythreonine-4-phosphate dehydrogenase PdxA [Ignavibacteriaceae bacterium]|nr:4-hydroxythreonine-4-phosphate dehydrogenase PdxA [Ignavibacteriaceae bacterium]